MIVVIIVTGMAMAKTFDVVIIGDLEVVLENEENARTGVVVISDDPLAVDIELLGAEIARSVAGMLRLPNLCSVAGHCLAAPLEEIPAFAEHKETAKSSKPALLTVSLPTLRQQNSPADVAFPELHQQHVLTIEHSSGGTPSTRNG